MFKKLFVLLLLMFTAFSFISCEDDPVDPPVQEQDYVANLKLDMTSNTKKAEVTVKTFIDGDTTHFNINDPSFNGTVFKARYLAINTPESTGKVEEWGKAASDFTKSKLKNASNILIESNDDNWNVDKTGSRYMAFIWYKTSADADWRLLNLEILQNGYANPSNVLSNIYGETCYAALNQAKTLKLNLFSGEPDPNFYYGDAQLITLKTLRLNNSSYLGQKVAVEGVVTRNYNNGVYVENYDEETGLYFGTYCYYGTSVIQEVSVALNIGNYVRVVGTFQEFNGSYQISGLEYDEDSVNTTCVLEETPVGFTSKVKGGQTVYLQPYTTITATDFNSRKESIEIVTEVEGEETLTQKEFNYSYLIMNTTVKLENLYVSKTYTTTSDSVNSDGAMTLTCTIGDQTVKVRTIVLKDEGGNVITADTYKSKNITIKGVVDCFDGEYQIKVLNSKDITILN